MLVCISDEEIQNKCFNEWLDRHSEVKSKDDLRCAIVAYSIYVCNQLLDLYDVNMDERGE